MNKPFSQQQYDEDDHAKYQILEWLRTKDYKCEINPDQYGIDSSQALSLNSYFLDWLRTKGYKVEINPDQYGIDILGSRWGKNFQFEVEVKHNWHGQFFPYEQVHFSARKRKFVTLDADTWFVMLNHERTYALFIYGEDFMRSPVVMKDTKYSVNEACVEVDIQWAIFRDLQEEAN